MNENECADQLVDWLTDLLGAGSSLALDEQLKASYPFLPSQKGPLPDASAEVAQKRISRGAEETLFFPIQQIQQAVLRVFECQLTFMVEMAATPAMASDEAEQRLLRTYGGMIEESARADASLGGRLNDAFISPVMLFDYRLPFAQYQDGTRGRQASVVVAVGEMVPDEEITS